MVIDPEETQYGDNEVSEKGQENLNLKGDRLSGTYTSF